MRQWAAPRRRHRSSRALAAAVSVGLTVGTGCVPGTDGSPSSQAMYRGSTEQGFTIEAVPLARLPHRFRRQSVSFVSPYEPGTVVVDPTRRFVYLVEPKGRAIRYGASVGIGAFSWSGEAVVGRKQPWPRWTPTNDMIKRSPMLARYESGLAPGSINPLGARSMYLYRNGRDTFYRLHGTPEWWSIGKAASSGCIRLLNQDILDLYDRVPLGAKVVVLPEKP